MSCTTTHALYVVVRDPRRDWRTDAVLSFFFAPAEEENETRAFMRKRYGDNWWSVDQRIHLDEVVTLLRGTPND